MKRRKSRLYSSDRPITKFPEDKLSRGPFAERLANDIAAWGGENSLVVGLFGDWGSGKTSLKNLVLTSLEKKRNKLSVLEFNPWQLSGSGVILESFFRELAIVLGSKSGKSQQATTEARERLRKYSSLLTLGSVATRILGPLLVVMGRSEVGAGALAASGALGQAAEVTKAGSDAAEPQDVSLDKLKKFLDEDLRKLDRPLLVVIDDIDRLTTREILDVFQLVKVTADFPNVIYLLLFERSIVAAALDEVSNNRGGEFLEKIVQVGYHVPRASRASIQKILFNGLDQIVGRAGVSRRWNKRRWSDVYFDGIQPFFRNLRHVYRFLSSLDFHVRQFQRDKHFEVNPIDLIALETLRVFEPKIFELLAVHKTLLTRDTGKSLYAKIKQEDIESTIAGLLTHTSKDKQDVVRNLVSELFPPTRSSYSGERGVGEHLQQWLRDARVCHPSMFDRYFALSVDEGELAQAELDQMIDGISDSATFVEKMKSLQMRGLLPLAFEHLDAHKETIPLESMPALVKSLSDISDLFPPRAPGMFEVELRLMAARMIYFGLRREKDKAMRLKALLKGFSESAGTLLPVFVTSLQEPRKDNGEQHDYLIEETGLTMLRDLSLARIREAAKSGRLVKHPDAGLLLWRWSDWALEEARTWVATEIQNSKGALWLIALLLGEVHTHGSEVEVRYYIHLKTFERFVDLNTLKSSLDGVDLVGANERERIALKEFTRAVERRAEGKPDATGHEVDNIFD